MDTDLQVIPEEEPEAVQVIPDDVDAYTFLPIDSLGEVCLFDPLTKDMLDGSATAEQLVVYRDHLRTVKRLLGEATQECDARLTALMDRNASWTVRAGGVKASAPSAAAADKEEWDGEKLYAILVELVEDGAVTRHAVDAAVEVKTEYKTKHAGIVALRRVPAVAEAIAPACTVVPVTRRVTLS